MKFLVDAQLPRQLAFLRRYLIQLYTRFFFPVRLARRK